MYITVISNRGMGIYPSPIEAEGRIRVEPVIEVRSFYDCVAAYRFACYGLLARRKDLGKTQFVPLPQMEEFGDHGKFFHYPDMPQFSGWESIENQMIRYFAFSSGYYFGILSSSTMVASALEQCHAPAVASEVNSKTAAQHLLLSQVHMMMMMISPYLSNQVRLPNDISLEIDVIYPWPDANLQSAGKQIWGNNMVQLLPSIDHTPKQVMSITSPKK